MILTSKDCTNISINCSLRNWFWLKTGLLERYWLTHRIARRVWKSESESVSCSIMSDSLQPLGLYSPPDSSAHGILQARILEWVAIPFSRGSSRPRIEPRSPALQADSLPSEPPGKPGDNAPKWVAELGKVLPLHQYQPLQLVSPTARAHHWCWELDGRSVSCVTPEIECCRHPYPSQLKRIIHSLCFFASLLLFSG